MMTTEKTTNIKLGALAAAALMSLAMTAAPAPLRAQDAEPAAPAVADEPALQPAPQFTEGAKSTIDAFHEDLIAIMKTAKTTDEATRRDQLKPAVEKTFDLRYMTEKTTGRFWTGMTEQDRATLIDIFSRLTIANYADRFSGYSGQKFVTESEQALGQGKLLIKTALVKPDGEKVAINYLMHETGDGWSVIDIYLAGKVSELATRRSDFYATLRDKGVDGLINVLTEKVAQIEAQTKTR